MKMFLGIKSIPFLFQNTLYLYKHTDTGYKRFSPDTASAIQTFMWNSHFPSPVYLLNQHEEEEVYESLEMCFSLTKKVTFRRPKKCV